MICYLILIIVLAFIILINMYNCNYNYLTESQKVNKLIRQTARWAAAAEQDENAYIANLHATYALGYLMALREIYTDEVINKLSNVDVRMLETQVTNIMDGAVKKLVNVCPQGQPKNKFLSYLSKEGNFNNL